jgi:hypothetical protein
MIILRITDYSCSVLLTSVSTLAMKPNNSSNALKSRRLVRCNVLNAALKSFGLNIGFQSAYRAPVEPFGGRRPRATLLIRIAHG